MTDIAPDETLRERVRRRYASAATAVEPLAVDCCGGTCDTAEHLEQFGAALYTPEERAALPDAAKLTSLGCGNPTAVATITEGEVVLDLGSGGGIDVLLSARRVGSTGKVYGVDMTDEMLALARRNAAEAGATNVEFVKGHIEAIPLPAEAVDLVISNCVINLSVDKPVVMHEMYRVLRAGGRIGISDIIAENHLSADQRAERGSYIGCIAGALSESEYRAGLAAAGFADIEIVRTQEVADAMHSAIIRASKPAEAVHSTPGDPSARQTLAPTRCT